MAVVRMGTPAFGKRAKARKERLEMGYPIAGGGMMAGMHERRFVQPPPRSLPKGVGDGRLKAKERRAISASDAEMIQGRLRDEKALEADVGEIRRKKPGSRKQSAPYGEHR